MIEPGFYRVDVPGSDLHKVGRTVSPSPSMLSKADLMSIVDPGRTDSPSYSLNSAITGAWSLGFSRDLGALSIQQPVHFSASEGVVQIWSMRRPRFRCHAPSR